MKIKSLGWDDFSSPVEKFGEYEKDFQAQTPFGYYSVFKLFGKWRWGYCFDEYYDEGDFPCDSLEHGKRLAWENWVSRITPCLEEDS